MRNSLIGVLLSLRQGNIGFAVQSMLHQVCVREQDQDAHDFSGGPDGQL